KSTAYSTGVLEGVLTLRNSGGGAPISWQASTLRQATWITDVTPSSGRTAPNGPIAVRVRVNPQGLNNSSYRDVVRFTWSDGTIDVPVVIFVAEPGPSILVDLAGQRFQSKQGTGFSTPQAIQIGNGGDPGTTLNWTAEILQGDSWFGFDGLSRGSIAAGKSATLSLAGRAGSADRPVGGSYGLIRISDPAASNSPQYVVIVLDQSASTTPVVPDFAPGPLVLSVPTGSAAQPASVRVFV